MMRVSETSTYTGPYARLREIIRTEREAQYDRDAGAYSKGYIEALDSIEKIVIELENALEPAETESMEAERCRLSMRVWAVSRTPFPQGRPSST